MSIHTFMDYVASENEIPIVDSEDGVREKDEQGPWVDRCSQY